MARVLLRLSRLQCRFQTGIAGIEPKAMATHGLRSGAIDLLTLTSIEPRRRSAPGRARRSLAPWTATGGQCAAGSRSITITVKDPGSTGPLLPPGGIGPNFADATNSR